jgi:hypothetical protein
VSKMARTRMAVGRPTQLGCGIARAACCGLYGLWMRNTTSPAEIASAVPYPSNYARGLGYSHTRYLM